jgi:hypothetical protein
MCIEEVNGNVAPMPTPQMTRPTAALTGPVALSRTGRPSMVTPRAPASSVSADAWWARRR